MGLFSKILRREEATTTGNQVEASDALLRALLSGEEITRETAMSVPAVAAAIDRIANVVGMLPVRLYQEGSAGEGRRKVVEIHGDNRTTLLNVDTSDLLDSFQFKKAMATDYLIDKGAFAYIEKKGARFTGLYHVEPSHVTYYKNTDPIYKTASYQVGDRRLQTFQLVIMLRQTRDGIVGVSVIDEVRKALATALANVAFELGIVKKGGSKKGFLESDKILDQKQMDVLRAGWSKLYSSTETQENIVILNNGVKFKEAAATSVEMQLNERKKQLAEEINGIFHVSEKYEDFVKEAVMPVLNAFEAALSRNLLTEEEKEAGYYFRFDTKEITKGDIKTRYDAYKTATEAGYLTKNEIRYMDDLDPIDGLDVVSLGLGDVLFDTKTGEYYTPNTGDTKVMGDGQNVATASQPFSRSKRETQPVAAGLAVVAEDTGRVLMLQRAKTEDDPAGGYWEFPGGHIDEGENPLAAAFREWSEEVGRRVPAGKPCGAWRSADGKYLGYVWSVRNETVIGLDNRSDVTNPDDPDGDKLEAIAWFEPEHLADNPAIRAELAADIELVQSAISKKEQA